MRVFYLLSKESLYTPNKNKEKRTKKEKNLTLENLE